MWHTLTKENIDCLFGKNDFDYVLTKNTQVREMSGKFFDLYKPTNILKPICTGWVPPPTHFFYYNTENAAPTNLRDSQPNQLIMVSRRWRHSKKRNFLFPINQFLLYYTILLPSFTKHSLSLPKLFEVVKFFPPKEV